MAEVAGAAVAVEAVESDEVGWVVAGVVAGVVTVVDGVEVVAGVEVVVLSAPSSM